MTPKFALTRTAEQDLESILLYIAEHDGIARALRVQLQFIRAIETLVTMPRLGFKRSHLTGNNIRWLTIFRFAILYDPDSSPLTVLRVLHGGRDLDQIIHSGS